MQTWAQDAAAEEPSEHFQNIPGKNGELEKGLWRNGPIPQRFILPTSLGALNIRFPQKYISIF